MFGRSEAGTAMTSFLFGAAVFVLAMVSLGIFRILRGPVDTDRMMAAQLIGTGGVAVLLLVAVATAAPSIVDVALMLALLAAFASIGFVVGAAGSDVGGIESPRATDRG